MAAEQHRRVVEPDLLRALAKPLRIRLIYALVELGPAPVTALATHLDEAVGGVSYHLRQLARFGIVAGAPELARDRRERWWRLIPVHGISHRPSDVVDDPVAQVAARAVEREFDTVHDQYHAQWVEQATSWSIDWQDAAKNDSAVLALTATELAEFDREYQQLIAKWSQHGEAAGQRRDIEGRANVFVLIRAFPRTPVADRPGASRPQPSSTPDGEAAGTS